MSLIRRFTPISLLILSINGMIGSAWLFAPLYAAKLAGPYALIAWIIGGALTLVIAFTFVELSVLFPVAGGSAQIPQRSHGAITSFMFSWIAWLSSLTMAPIEVQAILQYASTYFTSLMQMDHGNPVLTHVGLIWAAILMLLFTILNVTGYKTLVRFNSILFTFKVAVIILTIILLIKTQFYANNFIASNDSLVSWHAVLVAVSTSGVAFAFTGFKHGVELAGETQQYALALPLAIAGSVIVSLLLYLGLQIAFVGSLSPEMLVNGWNQINFIGDAGPFAGLAIGLGLVWLVKLLYIDAAISPAGAGLVYMTSTARILYAMSQLKFLPNWLSYLNKHDMPLAAILVNFVLGMFLFLPLPGWQAMVGFLVSGMVISYAMGPIALLCMRLEMPDKPRPFRLPVANFTCLLAFYFCNLLSYWCGWQTIYKLAIAMSIGAFFIVIAYLRGSFKQSSLGFKSSLWLIPYLIGLVTISYLGSFGGKNIIPFGWDFLVIGIFSIIILYIAVKNRAAFQVEQAQDEIFIVKPYSSSTQPTLG